MRDLIEALNKAHELDEAAFSGGVAGDNSASGGTVRGRGASTQPSKKNYLGRLKNKNPDLVEIVTVKGKDIKPGMITQAGQVKEAEVKKNNRGETKVYIMHTNNYDGFWGVDEDMEVLADPENKSKPFTGDYRALLKMGLKESTQENDLHEDKEMSVAVKDGITKAFSTAMEKIQPCMNQLEGTLVEYFDKYKNELESSEAAEVKTQLDNFLTYINVSIVDKVNKFKNQLK